MPPRFTLCLAIFLQGAGLVSSARAENWAQFRGATGQGIASEKKLPLEWNAKENVKWQTEIAGEGWSSPIVWKDRVFVTSTSAGGVKCQLTAVDRKSGAIVWNTEVFEQPALHKQTRNSYATPTPTTDGELIYAVFGSGAIGAVDFSGKTVWANHDVKFYSEHGLGASPILHDDLLIMPFDGSSEGPDTGAGWHVPWEGAFILALDKKTGKERWRAKRGPSRLGHATPIVVQVGGIEQLVSIAGDVAQGFDLKDGAQIWSAHCQGEGLVPSPVAGGGKLFAASGFEKTTLRGLQLGGRGEITQIAWEQRKGVPTLPSLLYVEPFLYAVTEGGVATCYKETTGEVVWQERVGGAYSASPVYANGRIYLLSESGETVVLEPGPVFKVLSRNPIFEKCQASPAVSDGQLFIRGEKHLFCIGGN